jgi:tetratricopeptide (TPR) repeat protein
MSKAVKAETSESFAVTYYSNNPVDTRTPPDKLAEVESRLGEKIDADERFSLLVQKKTLCQMIYGENSPEVVRATTELGSFYNEHGRADSALRNLQKVSGGQKQTPELEEADAFALAVEYADALLNSYAQSKSDKLKQVGTAETTLSPYIDTPSDNGLLCYRRDLCIARIKSTKNRNAEALEFYDKAVNAYTGTHPEEKDEEGNVKENPDEAHLYFEAGQVAEKVPDPEKAQFYYQKAIDLYEKLGYEEDMRRAQERLDAVNEMSPGDEGEQEPEPEPEPEKPKKRKKVKKVRKDKSEQAVSDGQPEEDPVEETQ